MLKSLISLKMASFFLLAFLSTVTFAAKPYTLTVKYQGCLPAKLMLYEFDGIGFNIIETKKPSKDSVFQFTVNRDEPIMYFVGQQPNVIKPVIFGLDQSMSLSPMCRKMPAATFSKGTYNQKIEKLLQESLTISRKEQSIVKKLGKGNHGLKDALQLLDSEKLTWKEQKTKEHPYMGLMANLGVFLSFANNDGNYGSDVEYFAREYFHFVNFKDAKYNTIPMVFDAFKTYASTINRFRVEDALKQVYIEEMLEKIPTSSRTYRYALGGVTMAFRGVNAELFTYFGKMFLKKFSAKRPTPSIVNLQRMLSASHVLDIGKEAPEFTLNDTNDQPVNLSDFRGKVLLLDFWASWCGPCRRENPNVKRLYAKYHDKGFDVLSVSLDRKKASWLAAIKKDQLPWTHISDIKGWQCAPAQLYKVRSIPATFLIDRNGKLLAKGLRGPALEKALQQIFGE